MKITSKGSVIAGSAVIVLVLIPALAAAPILGSPPAPGTEAWRRIGGVEIGLGNNTFSALVVAEDRPPGVGSNFTVNRMIYVCIDTDMNASSGRDSTYYYGYDAYVYATRSLSNGLPGIGFNAYLYFPNGTVAAVVRNISYVGYNDTAVWVEVPKNELGIASDDVRVVYVSYSTYLSDWGDEAVNATLPAIPEGSASNSSKWGGVEPIIADKDPAGSADISPYENLTKIYAGLSSEGIHIRFVSDGELTEAFKSLPFWYVFGSARIDLDSDGVEDYYIYVRKYRNSVVAGVKNISSGKYLPTADAVIEVGDGDGAFIEAVLNASLLGINAASNTTLSLTQVYYGVYSSHYLGGDLSTLTRLYVGEEGVRYSVTPTAGSAVQLRGDRYAVYSSGLRVNYEHVGDRSYISTYSAAFDTLPVPDAAVMPEGNRTPIMTLHVRPEEKLIWPLRAEYRFLEAVKNATAYRLDHETLEFKPLSQQYLNTSTRTLVLNITRQEYGRVGEAIIVITYELGTPPATTTTTTPQTTTTTTQTTTSTTTTTLSPVTTTTTETTSSTTTATSTTTALTTTTTTHTTTTTQAPTTTTAVSTTQTSSPVTTSETHTPTTTQTTSGENTTQTAPEGGNTGTYVVIGVAALAIIAIIAFLIMRGAHR